MRCSPRWTRARRPRRPTSSTPSRSTPARATRRARFPASASASTPRATRPRSTPRSGAAWGTRVEDGAGPRASLPLDPAGRYRALDTGQRFSVKPDHLTHLMDDASLVPKTHPRIIARGKLDLLQSAVLDAQTAADAEA